MCYEFFICFSYGFNNASYSYALLIDNEMPKSKRINNTFVVMVNLASINFLFILLCRCVDILFDYFKCIVCMQFFIFIRGGDGGVPVRIMHDRY